MRTSNMRVPAFVLPFLIAVAGPGAALAQQAAPTVEQDSGRETVFTGDHMIEAGETVEEVVVVGGDLTVAGEVTGNAVVVGGDLILQESAVVQGDAIVTGGELMNEGGRVRGEMRTLAGPGIDIAREIQRAIEGGAARSTAEFEAAPRAPEARVIQRSSSERRFISREVRRGFAGIISTLGLTLVLAGIGAALVFYGRPYLETVSDTVRGSSLRAGATGLAASFLAIPAFVVLVVALVVSIVGIPFLLLAVPLYPVALFAAAVYGLLAVMHAIGERTAEQSRDRLDLRYRNSYAYLLTGLGMLFLPMMAAHMISMTGFLSFIGVLLMIVTCLAIWVAATVGFGAVILSRAGTRRTFVASTPRDPTFNTDDLIDDDLGISGHE